MRIKIEPSIARGRITLRPAKSILHRLLIGAACAQGESRLAWARPLDTINQDVDATIRALQSFGLRIAQEPTALIVRGDTWTPPTTPVDCGESGSTLRFLIPFALLMNRPIEFTGKPRLFARPLGIYEELCRAQRLSFERSTDQLRLQGPLNLSDLTISGTVSSQFATGLLFALSARPNPGRLRVKGPIVSRPYLALTEQILFCFGVDPGAVSLADGRAFRPRGRFQAGHFTVDPDASTGAVYAVLNALGGAVALSPSRAENEQRTGTKNDASVHRALPQADTAVCRFISALDRGAPTISLRDTPDLGPLLFVYSALRHGATFTDIHRLRAKESDRVQAMHDVLLACGGRCVVEKDRVHILKAPLHPPEKPLAGQNDHRIIMAETVLFSVLGGTIDGAAAVLKSDPSFFEDLRAVGIRLGEE